MGRSGPRGIDIAWIVLPALLPAIVGLLTALGAIDLAYHVRTGDAILETWSIPRVDTYTFSIPGQPWTDQQWGAQVVLAILSRFGGWATLGVAQAVLIGGSFWVVACAARSRGASPRVAAALSLVGFFVAAPALAMRPQLLALPLVAVTVLLVAGRRDRPGLLLLVPLLAVVAANLHGSFILFPLILGLAWIDDMVERASGSSRLLALTAVAALATLINPFGIGVWSYAYDLINDPVIRDTVTEWAPVTFSVGPGGAMIVSALAVAVFLARRSGPAPWGSLVTLSVFFLLAMTSVRSIVWWAVIAPVVVAGLLPVRSDGASERPAGSSMPALALIGTMCLAIVALLPWWRADAYAQDLRFAPEGLTRAVEDELDAGALLFVHQPWGSWFEFARSDMTVFVDSRIELFPESVWEDYGEVAFAGDDWHDVLERWQPDAVIAEAGWELLPRLREDPAWRLAHEDTDGVLLVRN